MSRVEAVTQIYEEWERGNFRAGRELYADEMTLQVHNPIPDAGVYDTVEGLQRYMRRFLETWEDYEIRAVDVAEDGDQVVVLVHHGGRARGAWTESDFTAVWTFEGERVTRMDIGGDDREGLLRAARES